MRWHWILGLAAMAAVDAQQFVPHAGYVYPAGGRQGSDFEATVGGQFLEGVKHAYLSGSGVQVKVIEHVKPLTQGQFNQLREKLKELMDKSPASAEDRKAVAEIRQKIMTFIRRPSSPAIAETVRLQVTVAPDAAPGRRELRLAANLGVTNPLALDIGQLPEFSKPPAKPSGETPFAKKAVVFRPQPVAPISVTLPATINGQIMPGGVDRYRFPAVKGQRLVVAAAARELIPYISDAVPG
ncbi:MAG: hypothetical protein HY822_22145, partial [Acidobacteria bacterium]|nr:hypothetical protein [Acidobacteriota bacterium]